MKNTAPCILGIDPATATGVAVVDFEGNLLEYETKKAKACPFSRTSLLRHTTHTYVSRYNVQAVGIEEPNRFHYALKSGFLMIGAALTVLSDAGLKDNTYFWPTDQIRKGVMGEGAVSAIRKIKDRKAKKQYLVDWVKQKYPAFDGDDNAADAVMIALYTLEQVKK